MALTVALLGISLPSRAATPSSIQSCRANIVKQTAALAPSKRQTKPVATKRYFKKVTYYTANTADYRGSVTFDTKGNCREEGYVYYEGAWTRGDAYGRYYIKGSYLYIRWEGCGTERYRLQNGTYRTSSTLYRQQP